MRKVLFIAAGLIVGIVAIGAAILLFVDVNQFREPIRAQLEKRLQRSVSIGKLGLKIVPLSIRLDDVSIGDSPAFQSQNPFVAAKEVFVRVGLGALLQKQVDVQSLHLVQPALELIKNANGEWNFSTLGGASGSSSNSAGGGTSVQLSDLQIDDGRIAVTDLQAKKPRAVYDHIDLTLSNFAPGKRFTVDAQAHLPAKGKELIRLHASADTPTAGKSLANAGLDGNVVLESVSMTGLEAFLGSTPSDAAKAVLNGQAQFQSTGSILTGKGNIEVTEPRLKEPAKLDFEMKNEGETGLLTVSSAKLKLGALALNGNAKIQTKVTPAIVTADFRTDNASVTDLLNLAAAFGAADGITGTGLLSLDGHVNGPANALAYNATGTLRDAKLTLDTLKKPIEIQSVGLKLAKDQAGFDNLSAALGSSHLHGNLAVRNFAHPDLQFNADVDRLDTAELQQIVVPSTGKKSGSSGPMNLTGNGTVSVGTLTYNQLALTNVHATCKLENGIIRLDPLNAKLFGGDQGGSIAVDTRQQETAFDVHAKINKVDANKLLSATTSVKDLLYGMLSGDIDVHANPHKGEDPARALNGTVRVQLNDGKLMGVQLLNEMASLAKFIGYSASNQAFTNIVKLGGTLKIQNGVANTDDLQMQFVGGSMAAAGTIGLSDQQLKMRVTTILPKEVGRAGGQIGGLMSTVLANSKGELVIPALVSGTFAKPKFEPDAQRMAKMKLDGLLPTKDNPVGAVSQIQGILGALSGKGGDNGAKAGQPAAPATNAPQKKPGILDIIDSVRKKSEQK